MWAQFINAAIGLWLMAAPEVIGFGGAPADSDQIVGPIAATFAIIAITEITRATRWVNVPLGLWLLVAPWILDAPIAATISDMLCGAILVACSFVPGKRTARYGGGWPSLWRDPLPGLSSETSGPSSSIGR